MTHIPVLLKEIVGILDTRPGEFFIDGTLGSGGHTAKIFEKILPNGKLLGVDLDKDNLEKAGLNILAEVKSQKSKAKSNLILVHGNYANLPEILRKHNLPKANGLLIDLGFSSEQLEKSGRGFSFLRNEPLGMRYNTQINVDNKQINADNISVNQCINQRESAAVVVNNYNEKDLADIFYKYGEERFSRRIAKKIIEERRKRPIKTTFDLVEIIKSAIPYCHCQRSKVKSRAIHPATRVFQALRIYVNNELGNLEKLLKNLDKIIKNKGRIAIISYHSLEDRLVKNYFREMIRRGGVKILTKKPIRPTLEEIISNPRSRSAKMRAILLNH